MTTWPRDELERIGAVEEIGLASRRPNGSLQRYGGHVVNISATLAEVAGSSAPSVLAALTRAA